MTRKNKEINRCIYCGVIEGKLSDEHIIPFAFTPKGVNHWMLLRASCNDCANITSRFEGIVLRGAWRAARASLRMSTRRNYPNTFPIEIWHGTQSKIIELPLEETWRVLPYPEFRIPGQFDDRPDTNALHVVALGLMDHEKSFHEIAAQHHADKIGIPGLFLIDLIDDSLNYGPKFQVYGIAFARFLCKLAFCYAIYKFPRGDFIEQHSLPIIFGDLSKIGRWVGCARTVTLKSKNEYFRLQMEIYENDLWLRIRLNPLHEKVPEYMINVATLREEMVHLLNSIGGK